MALEFSSVQFSLSVMSNSLWLHGLQHARLPCSSPTPGAYSNSCPSSRWCSRISDHHLPTRMRGILPKPACLDVESMTVGEWGARVHHSPAITCWGCDADWPALGEMQRHWKKETSEKERRTKVRRRKLASLSSSLSIPSWLKISPSRHTSSVQCGPLDNPGGQSDKISQIWVIVHFYC